MKKKGFLTEAKRKAIIADKEKAIIESFAKTFNRIKRIDENEISTDINELEFYDSKASDRFPDESEFPSQEEYEKAYNAAAKEWETKRIPKLKAKVIAMAKEINELLEKAVDGLDDDARIKMFGESVSLDTIEYTDNEMIITYYGYYSTDTEKFNLNDYSEYGNQADAWDGNNLIYQLNRIKAQLKKAVSNIESKTNFYKYYVVDMDEKRILNGFNDKEWAVEELNDYNDYPNVKVVALKGLQQLGIEPLNVGGN